MENKEQNILQIRLTDSSQEQVNAMIKKLALNEIDILSVAAEKPTLEESLLKFWRDKNE